MRRWRQGGISRGGSTAGQLRKTRWRDSLPAGLVCPVADPAGPRAAGGLGRGRLSGRDRFLPSPEFRRSARTIDEYEQMSGMFEVLCPDAALPKGAWRWIESAEYRLLRQGAHRALSAVDLMICATAAQHDLVVLHDDKDFATAARYLPDVRERTIHDAPQPG